ncbi:MAG: hypothetical protein AAFQ82_20200 [Myxococcota bacterium]
MKRVCLSMCLAVAAGLVSFDAVAAKKKTPSAATSDAKPKDSAPPGEYEEQIDLGTADVLERLKLLRVQMALDREEIAALRLRIEKIQLQREFEALLGSGQNDAPSAPRRTRRNTDPTQNILVKAITLQPRKEAIIMYQGRIFNVRPGDSVGGVVIKDITEGGLRIQRSKGGGGTIR